MILLNYQEQEIANQYNYAGGIRVSIGENIKKIRTEKGLTQKQLAKKLGTSQQNLAQYEHNKRNPKIETLQKIADALNVPLAELDDTRNRISELQKELSLLKIEELKEMNRFSIEEWDGENMENMEKKYKPREDVIKQKIKILEDRYESIMNIQHSSHEQNYVVNTIGSRIKETRIKIGLSQEILAKKAGISRQTLQKYEKNAIKNISFKVIKKIALKLNTTPSYLMGWEQLDTNYIDLEDLLAVTEWQIQLVEYCNENPNCPLTDDEKFERWSDGNYPKENCEQCPYNYSEYILTNGNKFFTITENEYHELESCIIPYLLLRINELISEKKALSNKRLEDLGMGWLRS